MALRSVPYEPQEEIGRTKRCSKCGREKPLEEYHRQPTGRHGRRADCKSCAAARSRKWRADNPETARASVRAWTERHKESVASRAKDRYRLKREKLGLRKRGEKAFVTEKRCSACGQVKPASEFGTRQKNRDGLQGKCKLCIRRYQQKWNEENREKVNAYARAWRKRRQATLLHRQESAESQDQG